MLPCKCVSVLHLRYVHVALQLSEKNGGEERGQLSESDDADFGSKQDARDWLKALETSDPSWQHAE